MPQFGVRLCQSDGELFITRILRGERVAQRMLVLSMSSERPWSTDDILGRRSMSEERHLGSLPSVLLVYDCGGVDRCHSGKVALECGKRGNRRSIRKWSDTR